MDERECVLSEIRRIAAETGRVPGARQFRKLTGLKNTLWEGKHWPNWSAALHDAGFDPNELQSALPAEDLLRALAVLTRDLGRAPSQRDIKFAHNKQSSFPSHGVFNNRWPRRSAQLTALRAWCIENDSFHDIVGLLDAALVRAHAHSATIDPARPARQDAVEPDIDSLLPPAVALLRGLAVRDTATLAQVDHRGLNPDLEFERRTGLAFKLLGLDVCQLGQGTGRQADGVARCPEHGWALVYDAKLREGTYRMGTEDRKFREYVERHQVELQRAGIPKMYFAVVSGEFHERDLEKAHEVVRLTSAKSCVLLTVDALLALVERRLRDPRNFDFAWLERLLIVTRILRVQELPLET